MPYDNNSSSARETNSTILDSIGFGMQDTVHYYDADNPNSSQELMLAAYQSELAGEYEDAIALYKQVIQDTSAGSKSAPACLPRIFNCHLNKQATNSEYSSLESYCSEIAADTAYTEITRNIAEDIAIQCKVKQSMKEEALGDYENIYANNSNLPKGIHALINREILSAGAGDNLIAENTFEEIDLRQSKINALLKMLNAKNEKEKHLVIATPDKFRLSQNFPNPFNPVTTITYDLPNSGFVTLKVYDMLGREVKTLVNQMKTAGYHNAQFNADELASGAYFYRLSVSGDAGEFTAVRKCVVVK